MAITAFLPVTCKCSNCNSLFVEWLPSKDCEGKTRPWKPRIPCNNCFALRADKEIRESLAKTFAERNRQMLVRFPDADLKYCNAIHKKQIEELLASRTVCKPFGSDQKPSR